MGAFHEGHLDLMRRARQGCDQVVVSLFVNPTQFGPSEDLTKYPRDVDRDKALAESVGVNVLFVPTVDEMYGRATAWVEIPEISQRWEGQFRPTHFKGVATVVAKLFNIVGPCDAFFGWKDLQQCAVIEQLVSALSFDINLEFCETVRESDGLAMSSRNAYLSPENRRIAPKIYENLDRARRETQNGNAIADVKHDALTSLKEAGFLVDYLEFVSLQSLEPLADYAHNAAWITAAKLGTTRLIDNVRMTT
jgi:pantoate--beta-alanine ligase